MSERYIGGLVYNPPGGWSGLFASGNYISAASNAAFALGTGDFTVEAWVYPNSAYTTYNYVFGVAVTDGLVFYVTGGNLVVRAYNTGDILSSSTIPPLNTWTHVAATRSGTTLRIFVNGVQTATTTNSTNFAQGGAYVGNDSTNAAPWYGYISNFRLVKGTAVYTANFTPPTGALLPIANTSLLTCAYPTFRDGSANNFTITQTGTVSVSTTNPFPTSVLPNPALGGAGNGIYTLSQYSSLLSAGTWPAYDPYYKNVTLNLHGNAGAVLPFNTDASTNNFQVTQVGDTRPSNYTPFIANGYWSNLFNGSSDYLTVASNVAFQFGTGDFTIEFWFNSSGTTSQNILIDLRGTTWNSTAPMLYMQSMVLYYYTNGAAQITGSTLTAGVWYHIAVARSGTTTKLFVNGTQVGSSYSDSNSYIQSGVYIGRASDISGNFTSGYLSNVRLVKGTAVYTTAFTPPTTPLTAISGTSLLTSQSNRFIDNSTNAFTITPNGSPSVNPYQPFTAPTGTSAYGSGYFDGSGDYLTSPNVAFASNNFTIEGWFYPTTIANLTNFWGMDNGSGSTPKMIMYINSSGNLTLDMGNAGTTQFPVSASASTYLTANAWNHIAIVRSGTGAGQLALYINGTSVSTGQLGTNISSITAAFNIGYIGEAYGQMFSGYISNFRIVNGTAVYTGNFTPSTTPLTAVTNTSLLTVQTNAPSQNNTFLDSSTNNFVINRNGNTTQGTLSPYGNNWSNNFISGSYLTFPDSQAFNLSGGSYTIECWINPTGNYSNYNTILAKRSGDSSSTFIWELFLFQSSGYLCFATNYGTAVNTGTTPTANQWSHVAVVYDGTNASIYLNGTRLVVGATANTNGSSSVYVGSYPTYSEQFLGSISNMRITKGATLYTGTSFTVPTDPLTNVVSSGNVVLLTCQDNRFRDNSPVNATTTVTGSPTVQKSSPFSLATQTYSSYGASFDGSGDYVTAPSNAAFALGTGDYTWEVWIYKTTSVRVNLTAISGGQGLAIAINTSGNLEVCRAGTAIDYTFTAGISNNVWTHLAVTRSGTSLRAFKDGTLLGTQTSSNNYGQGIFYIAIDTGGTGDTFAGSMSNLRLVKGTALYTASFTVPTSPLTAVSGTSLLTLQSSSFIDNSSNAFALTSYGTAQPILANPFGYGLTSKVPYSTSIIGGSGYFDGNDSLSVPYNSAFVFPGDFTVEFWVNFSAHNQYAGMVACCQSGSITGWQVIFSSTSNNILVEYTGGSFTSSSALVPNQWNHVAFVRSGSSMVLYINGLSAGTATSSTTFDSVSSSLLIGVERTALYYTTGYISNVRIVKGTAVYTSAFTPPTAPLTAINGTTFLGNFANAGIIDNAMMNVFETLGNAQLSTSVKKYGSGSIYLDGSGDYLVSPSSDAYQLGTGNFTIEFWINASASGSYTQVVGTENTGTDDGQWRVGNRFNSQNQVYFSRGTGSGFNEFQASVNVNDGAWHHVAVVRNSGTVTIYVDGMSSASSSISGTCSSSFPLRIGYNPRDNAYVTGYIDDLRITKGVARYTANFKPPTSQLQDQ